MPDRVTSCLRIQGCPLIYADRQAILAICHIDLLENSGNLDFILGRNEIYKDGMEPCQNEILCKLGIVTWLTNVEALLQKRVLILRFESGMTNHIDR
jgi:hypothetical protein